MMIHDVTAEAGKYKQRKRIGRGQGSGWGKQSGRGHKGAKSRSGFSRRQSFEGGQMPYFRRIPKFGFTNAQFKTKFWIVNLGDIVAHESFAKGGEVTVAALVDAGLVRDASRDLKILGGTGRAGDSFDGLKVKLDVTANRVSDAARSMIEGAGGKVNELGTRRDMVRGIDRNSDDRKPTNLTKKLKRKSKGGAAPVHTPDADSQAD